MTETLKAETGTFQTEHASKYLQQLCKHFAHKIEVEYDAEKSAAALPPGPAELHATDSDLTVRITGKDEEALKVARYIIDSHLERFAFRENFETMDWHAA